MAITFASIPAGVQEGLPLTVIATRTDTTTANEVVTLGIPTGSATLGTDYTIPVSFTFANNSPTATFSIPILNDGNTGEASETFTIPFTTNGAAANSPVPSLVVSIAADSGSGGGGSGGGVTEGDATITFAQSSYTVDEGAGFVTVTVRYTGTSIPGDVGLKTFTVQDTAGTATGSDYTSIESTRTFGDPDNDTLPGLRTAQDFTFNIPINNDTLVEEGETFSVGISDSKFAFVGIDTAVVTIRDNDGIGGGGTSDRGLVQFGSPSYSINENAGYIDIPITRTGGSSGVVTFTVRNRDLSAGPTTVGAESSAFAGQDYNAIVPSSQGTNPNVGAPGQLIVFGDGDTSTKFVRIPIINDTTAELTEAFAVDLIENRGQDVLLVNTTLVSILDDDSGEGGTVGPGTNPTFGPEAPFFPVSVDGNNEIFGSAGNDTLFGGKGNDSVTGLGGNDTVYGGQDQDSLFGNLGNDFLYANKGNDTIFGGQGDDILYGGQGDDTIFGNDGNDFLAGDIGVDVLAGAGGSDRFAIQAAKGTDFVADFIVGEDLLSLTGGLQFGDVSILQSGGDTRIRLNSSGDDLLVLVGVQSFLVTAASFITE
jgi:Ca2+-binding RTX toxin-like protein